MPAWIRCWPRAAGAGPDGGQLVLLSTHGRRRYTDLRYRRGAYLLFGNETAGLPAELRARYETATARIPDAPRPALAQPGQRGGGGGLRSPPPTRPARPVLKSQQRHQSPRALAHATYRMQRFPPHGTPHALDISHRKALGGKVGRVAQGGATRRQDVPVPVPRGDVDYFDCELPSTRQELSDPERFLRNVGERRVILDEIHRLPDPSELLKIAADYHPKTHIVATGSSSLGASRRFRDTLTDRKRDLWLTPMLLQDEHEFGTRGLDHRFQCGGLPPFYLPTALQSTDFRSGSTPSGRATSRNTSGSIPDSVRPFCASWSFYLPSAVGYSKQLGLPLNVKSAGTS